MKHWEGGQIWDRYLDGDRLLGTIMLEGEKYFWHRYSPEDKGYEESKEEAMRKVENGN